MRFLFLSRLSLNLGDQRAALAKNIRDLSQCAPESSSDSPLFNPSSEIVARDISKPETWANEHWEAVIVGGGGLLGPPIFDTGWQALQRIKTRVAIFGVGQNLRRGQTPSPAVREFLTQETGSHFFRRMRDYDFGEEFSPCPSMVSQGLACFADLPKSESAVGYWHNGRRVPRGFRKLPFLTNVNPDFDAVLRHLAAGQEVVTNSYHGLIWSKVLGGDVKLIDGKWSSKFKGLHPDSHCLGSQQALLFSAFRDLLDWLGPNEAQ